MLTAEQLQSIMPHVSTTNTALSVRDDEFVIDTPARRLACLAQLAHESVSCGSAENSGTTDAQRVQPVTTLSQQLGNTQPGDGRRFKGRGPIQLLARQLRALESPQRRPHCRSGTAALPEVGFRWRVSSGPAMD
jgi:predicted chitinase